MGIFKKYSKEQNAADKMRLRVVLVEPTYDINVGYVCRLMANFGLRELRVVNPLCELGFDAVKFSKHGVGVLRRAKKVRSLKQAIHGCDFVIGTTGIVKRNAGTIRDVTPLRQFIKKLEYYKGKTIALVFGREGTGLNENEITMCDELVTIEASGKYPILNLSHAAAIVFYELSNRKLKKTFEPVSTAEKRALLKMVDKWVVQHKIKNVGRVRAAFRRLLSKGMATKEEGIALLSFFKIIGKRS